MSLPEAVEKAAKEADELLQKMQQSAGEAENTGEPAPDETQDGDKSEGEGVEKAEGALEEKPEPAAAKSGVDPKEYERLKNSHSVLQGKYNAEVPRLHERIRELEAQLAEAKRPAQPSGAKPQTLDGVLGKLAEEYGDEFAANVQSAIDQKVEAAVGTVRGEIDSVKKTVGKSREDRFVTELTTQVPNWRDVFNDPRFSEYLDNVDDFSGKQLRDLAQEANDALDANRLARFYKAFLNSVGETNTTETKKKDKREALLSPETSTKTETGEEPKEKADLIKASEIERFYRDVQKGAFTYRQKEREAIEARINNAIARNWITEG